MMHGMKKSLVFGLFWLIIKSAPADFGHVFEKSFNVPGKKKRKEKRADAETKFKHFG
jgi:hypothetical protein